MLLFSCILYLSNCFAQETIERRNRLTDSVIEKFSVLAVDKTTKQGPYQALFKRRRVIATGNYVNNKKRGIWSFYKPNGIRVESYDYSNNELTFESPLDTMADVHYLVDEKLADSDVVTRSVKIGGVYYGLIPYLTIFRLPFDTMDLNTNNFDVYVELLISPLGRLAEYKVRLISAFYQYDHSFSLDVNLFSEADKTFVPVTVNGKAVVSRLLIRCYLSQEGILDFY